jgi:putative acetyltransferase
MNNDIPLRPFLPQDLMALRDLFAQSIEELTQEEYDEDQRLAWISCAADADEFGERLGAATTLVVEVEDELAGFGSLKDNRLVDMLYVHPYFVGRGVGTALADALETLAKARGASEVSVEASDSAAEFFAERGYVPKSRNSVPLDDQWLMNTTMTKAFGDADKDNDK